MSIEKKGSPGSEGNARANALKAAMSAQSARMPPKMTFEPAMVQARLVSTLQTMLDPKFKPERFINNKPGVHHYYGSGGANGQFNYRFVEEAGQLNDHLPALVKLCDFQKETLMLFSNDAVGVICRYTSSGPNIEGLQSLTLQPPECPDSCNWCGKMGATLEAKSLPIKCSACQRRHYCSANCQKDDLLRHKPFCKPSTIPKSVDTSNGSNLGVHAS